MFVRQLYRVQHHVCTYRVAMSCPRCTLYSFYVNFIVFSIMIVRIVSPGIVNFVIFSSMVFVLLLLQLLYVSIFTTTLQMLAIVCYVMCILAATGILVDSVDRWIVAFVVLLFEDLVIFEPAKVMVAAAYWSLEKDSLPYY